MQEPRRTLSGISTAGECLVNTSDSLIRPWVLVNISGTVTIFILGMANR